MNNNEIFARHFEIAQTQTMTERQKGLLIELIHHRIQSTKERERWLTEIETFTRFDASEAISSFLICTGR